MGESPASANPSVEEEGELSNDGLSDLFTVDNTPADSEHTEIPVYEKKFSDVLRVPTEEEKAEQSKPKRPKPPANTCWNCNGEHALRDCTEPRNYEAINRNRSIFMNKQQQKGGKASRYHLDEEAKYPHFQPGKISRRLRRALGLQSNQLPRHIYRMRCVGYPPGWVEEAKVCHSGLSLFDSEGQVVADPGFEDGEIVAEGAKDKYDVKKIIEFPGFNCPHDPDIIDETERMNSKPMAERDSIKFMATMWQPKAVKAYKRRKMNTSDTSGTPNTPQTSSDKKRSLLLLDDMDLDSDAEDSECEDGEVSNDGEDIPGETEVQIPPQTNKRPASVSATTVEPKRVRVGDEVVEDCEKNEVCSTTETNSADVSSSNKDAASEVPTEAESPSTGRVKSVLLGTPVIVNSPFTSLPSADKFAKNICDVINFENLPDATGKYEKMSGLIKKVRNFVSKLNSEDDED